MTINEKRWKPNFIGICDIISSVVAFVFVLATAFVIYGSSLNELPASRRDIVVAANLQVDLFFIIFAVLALVGGIFALRRKRSGFILTGSLAASLVLPLLGIPASLFALFTQGVSKFLRIIILVVFIPVWLLVLLIEGLVLIDSLFLGLGHF